MLISRNWLSDFVDIEDLSVFDFSELITTKVAEVDETTEVALPVEDAIVCEVISVSPHSNDAKLKIVELDAGNEKLSVVCGAPNCNVGSLVALLRPGARFYKPSDYPNLSTVESKEIAGVQSAGFLASEAELGLSSDHQGIFTLNDFARAKPGAHLASVIGGSDVVLDIDNKSLTHRADLWSHLGFARELAAILGRKLKVNVDEIDDFHEVGINKLAALGSTKSKFEISIDSATKCRRFAGIELENVSVKQSPLWIRRRLFVIGAGVRNLVVDLSNYIMHDLGQPNHCYDADLLKSNLITIRLAKNDEEFIGLDAITRKLSKKDFVIADESGPIALGGVIGGQACSVNDGTKRLFLESANFDPVVVRKVTKRHQLRTDASNRFEKNRSPYSVPLAIHRFVQLITDIDSDVRVASKVVDSFVEKPKLVVVPVNYDFIRKRLGAQVDDNKIKSILSSLGFVFRTCSDSKKTSVTVPHERATRDVTIQEDLVEEIGRIYGYENIPEVAPSIESTASERDSLKDFEHESREVLSGAGFSEMYHYSFMTTEFAKKLGFQTNTAVELLNPVTSDERYMRTSLVPGMIDVVSKNSRYFDNISLFELGRRYLRAGGEGKTNSHQKVQQPAIERRMLCLSNLIDKDSFALGTIMEPAVSDGAEFYILVSAIKHLVRLATKHELTLSSIDATATQEFCSQGPVDPNAELVASRKWMHPYRSAILKVNGNNVGIIAEVSPNALPNLNKRVVIAEVDLESLFELRTTNLGFSSISKYPDSLFEMSVVMPKREPYQHLKQVITKGVSDVSCLRNLEVLSVYEGKPLGADEKSVSVKLSFSAPDRTLSSKELKGLQDMVIKAVQGSEYHLRS